MKMAMVSARLQALEAERAGNHERARLEHNALRRELAEGASGAELQSDGLRHDIDQQRDERLRAQAAVVADEKARQRQLLLQRTRERETLDTLEAHFRQAQQRRREHRDQAALDEGFLLGRGGSGQRED